MIKLKIGGVPEHFNLPWHLAIENNEFKKVGIDLVWKDFPGGTGAMCKALRNKEIDISILLTEGIIKDIINGNESKIVQTYINSPLLWGIHVGANSNFQTVDDLEGAKPAISRNGSGSQLLAIVNAKKNGWNHEELDFEIVGNLDGGINALTNGTADYFMWEHFMTKPLVDNGTFRRVGDCPSPWPCFMIAVRNDVLENNLDEVKKVLKVINNKVKPFSTQAKKERYISTFSQRYQLEEEDVANWLSITEWNQGKRISKTLVKNIQNKLYDLNVIDKMTDVENLIKKVYL
ncbi:substrate-binding domain-containing protein [Urechidicola croceus]|uniref:ABC transporter substrate-binding protein n=1 Tax=Urechidicola croceus TaxID=1850246 RepID=A0A1D8P632_9FLAO|nr:substrate-binding domain-containing protein [Urechidicola croceus]AOW20020.1 ABC transporter substrate-binding protein [Urechidicola croceus]